MRNIQSLITLLIGLIVWGCGYTVPDDPKINGVSFVASSKAVLQENIVPVLELNANYASVMPFGFIKSLEHPEIVFNSDRQWYGETRKGVIQYIDKLHGNNIHVMLKPQLWIWHGEFTGNLKMTTETDWELLESSYRSFILEYAYVAEETRAEIFCIGTELNQFIIHRPKYWSLLIDEVRKIYHGKLTYAANWDEYKDVPFWSALDFIGVDAYFPVSESQTPSIKEARLGWIPWKEEMQKVATSINKKVVFTEYGYRSVDFAGKEPWNSDRSMDQVNLEAQKNLTQVVFEEIWGEKWFAGGFLWKWHLDHKKVGGVENTQFTPQNKPAELTVKGAYAVIKQ